MEPEVYYCMLEAPMSADLRARVRAQCAPDTLQRAGAQREEKNADLILLSELLTRVAIFRSCGIPPQAQTFDRDANGKPYLYGVPNVYFSRSHSGNLCVCAVYDRPIGVDVQERRAARYSSLGQIARRFFSAEENARLAECFGAARDDLFFDLWAQKESYLKYTGQGLSGLSEPIPQERRFVISDRFPGYSFCLCV